MVDFECYDFQIDVACSRKCELRKPTGPNFGVVGKVVKHKIAKAINDRLSPIGFHGLGHEWPSSVMKMAAAYRKKSNPIPKPDTRPYLWIWKQLVGGDPMLSRFIPRMDGG